MPYYDEAKQRAKRRRSPWNLALVPAVLIPLGALWGGSLAVLGAVHQFTHAEGAGPMIPDSVAGIVMGISPFFAFLAPSMAIGNILVAALPRARRALDREASKEPGTDLKSSNRELLRFSKVTTPVALGIGLAAAVWS